VRRAAGVRGRNWCARVAAGSILDARARLSRLVSFAAQYAALLQSGTAAMASPHLKMSRFGAVLPVFGKHAPLWHPLEGSFSDGGPSVPLVGQLAPSNARDALILVHFWRGVRGGC
jgi:hypothetical protein